MRSKKEPTVWVFNSNLTYFSSGIFSSRKIAEKWISDNSLSGLLTEYPLDICVYDWAIKNKYFTLKKESHSTPKFISSFTSAYQQHFHYKNGKVSEIETNSIE